MHQRRSHRGEKSSALAEERLRGLTTELKDFFSTSDPSPVHLKTIFEQHHPSSSVHESIITIYANSLTKLTLNRLLDRSIGYLQLNDGDHFSREAADAHALRSHRGTQTCRLIHHAIMKNYEQMFRLLLNSGFNPNSILTDGKTPLSMAVVASNIDPAQRLEYIQLLLAYGASPSLQDVNDVSPFKRLCGLESNYPIVYTFFRDHLLSIDRNPVQRELNDGLQNALFNWCTPILIDLLEHGATLDSFRSIDSLENFFQQMAATFFRERRSVTHIDSFLLCLIQLVLHGIACASYAVCIEKFFQLLYLPGVCFETNNDPLAFPSITNVKKLLSVSCHYGYLTRANINTLCTVHFSTILTTPIENLLVIPAIRQSLVDTLNQHVDGLTVKYQQSPVSLALLATRKIRQVIASVNQKTIEQLPISQHLKKKLL